MLLILFGVAIVTLVAYAWWYCQNATNFWKDRGVPYKKPLPFFGDSWPLLMNKKGIIQLNREAYEEFPNVPYFGYFDFTKPYLMVKDLELVERILIKDFHHFVDHGFGEIDETINPLDVNLFNMNGKKWKAMRNKLSPMFTSGKLRHMMPQITELSDSLVEVLGKNLKEVELRDSFQRFAMDVIASCAFGLSANTLQETEESEFRKMGKLAFKLSTTQLFRFVILSCFPKLAKKLKISQNDSSVVKYFSKIVKETLALRKTGTVTRNDFVQLMVTLQQKGSIEFEGDENDEFLKSEKETKKEHYELTDDIMAGHAFVFLIAGFEATSVAIMYLCYELAVNPEIQVKVRQEINRVLESRGGVLDYDAIKEMTYLSQCIKEMMRLHSTTPSLLRKCTADYTFPGTSLTIQAGQGVIIPVVGIHMDPAYYPDPEKFDPDRFSSEASRPNCSYLPFGDGPRICIAMRFALLEISICSARILQEFDIKLNPKTILPIQEDPKSFSNLPRNPLYFDLTKCKSE